MIFALTIIGGLALTNLVHCPPLATPPALAIATNSLIITSQGSNNIVVGDKIFLVHTNGTTANTFTVSTTASLSFQGLPAPTNGYCPYYQPGTFNLNYSDTLGNTWVQPLTYTLTTQGTYYSNYVCYAPLTYGSNDVTSISNLYGGYTSATSANWNLFEADGVTVSPTCWAAGLPWSCLIYGKNGLNSGLGADIVLVTSRHGVTTWHAGQLGNGTVVYDRGGDGVLYSNTIASSAQFDVDGQFITFNQNWTNAIIPAMVDPTNLPSLCDYSVPYLTGLYFRNNADEVSGITFSGAFGNFTENINQTIVGCVFNNFGVTGGDSSSPIFHLFGTNLILDHLVTYAGTGSGEEVGATNNYSYLLANIGTNQLRNPNTSGLNTY